MWRPVVFCVVLLVLLERSAAAEDRGNVSPQIETNSTEAEATRSGSSNPEIDFCPKVCIDQGCLVGKREKGNDQPYEAFYSIPYAAPPIGKLRFKVSIYKDFKACLIYSFTDALLLSYLGS